MSLSKLVGLGKEIFSKIIATYEEYSVECKQPNGDPETLESMISDMIEKYQGIGFLEAYIYMGPLYDEFGSTISVLDDDDITELEQIITDLAKDYLLDNK